MPPQPFTDPHIFEVNAKAIDMHHASRSILFSDAGGTHQFYADYRPEFVPVTVFVRSGDEVRARIFWANPNAPFESDY